MHIQCFLGAASHRGTATYPPSVAAFSSFVLYSHSCPVVVHAHDVAAGSRHHSTCVRRVTAPISGDDANPGSTSSVQPARPCGPSAGVNYGASRYCIFVEIYPLPTLTASDYPVETRKKRKRPEPIPPRREVESTDGEYNRPRRYTSSLPLP